MKFLETNFVDYINKCEENNLHKEITPIFNLFDASTNEKCNIIFYGPKGTGKYTQALNFIKTFSPTNLKYERKINFDFNKKIEYVFKISDIHFEIDMELLGCHAKILWNDIFHRILDIVSTQKKPQAFILCKNFHTIHSELLDIFYSYMQSLEHKNINLNYILISEQVGFIPNNILHRCKIVPIKRPTKKQYSTITNIKLDKSIDLYKINNIKDIFLKESQLMDPNKVVCDSVINIIRNYDSLNFLELRDKLYNIFIYHLDLNDCMWDIFSQIIIEFKIPQERVSYLLSEMYKFYKFYNNNYRPIYHLEKIILILCKEAHGL
jgi:hypothetical protein